MKCVEMKLYDVWVLFQSKPCPGVVGRGTDEKEDICGQPWQENTGLPSSLYHCLYFCI